METNLRKRYCKGGYWHKWLDNRRKKYRERELKWRLNNPDKVKIIKANTNNKRRAKINGYKT